MPWMSCVWPKAFRKKLPHRAQLHQLSVLCCYLRWGVENSQQLIANQNVQGRIASCRHQAGIWTGVKSSHKTSVCFHNHAHTNEPTTCTHKMCMHARIHTHTQTPTAEVTAVWQQPNPTCEHRNRNCNPPCTLSQLVSMYKVGQYCFQKR